MPTLAAKPCRRAGCGALVRDGSGYCQQHRREARQAEDARRGTSAQRGYGYRWQKVSKAFLRAHPLCQCDDCQEGRKRLRAAQVVDHKIPHKQDMALFWDRSNWQAMSKECHDKKTAREDGGFGRAKKSAEG